MESKQEITAVAPAAGPQTYRDLLEAIRIPGFCVSNPVHAARAAEESVARAIATGAAAATISRKRQYAEHATLRAAISPADAAPGWIDRIRGRVERGFAQEAIFNIVFVFHAQHCRGGELIPSGGNFSAGDAFAEFDIDAFMRRNIRSSGDKSDLTMLTRDKKTIVVFSSKCLQHYTNDMDVAKIKEIHQAKYPRTGLDIRFVVHNRDYFTQCIGAAHDTTTIKRNGHCIYDWGDIDAMIAEIRAARPNPFVALCRVVAPGGATTTIAHLSAPRIHATYHGRVTSMRPRFGQAIVSARIRAAIAAGARRVINGAMCRFGKSFCMAIDILQSARRLFVFVTTQPKTIPAIRAIFATHDEFKDFDMLNLNSAAVADVAAAARFAARGVADRKMIVFISVQALKRRAAIAMNLGIHDPLCMFDEFHIGGGTEATTDILGTYNLVGAQMIFYSATFSKIAAHYGIPAAHIITWGAEDNMLCARLGDADIAALRAAHGAAIVDAALVECGGAAGREAIRAHYGALPRLRFIINSPTAKCRDGLRDWAAIDDTKIDMGYSFDAVKMIEPDAKAPSGYKLVKPAYIRHYFMHMLGGGAVTPMGEWKSIHGRGLLRHYRTLYRADGQTTHGRIVPVYLGAGNAIGDRVRMSDDTLIGITGRLIVECIAETKTTFTLGYGTRYVIENYDAKKAANPERWFDELCAKHSGVKFIILFLGRALTTGVTNKHCDLMKLTNRMGSADLFWQTICRAMNEAPDRGKKYAYIAVDNYQSLAPMLDIVRGMKMPHESERGAWERLMGQNVFSIVDVHHGDRLATTDVHTPPEPGALYATIRDTVPYADNLRRFVAAVDFGNVDELRNHLIEVAKNAMADAAAAVARINAEMEKRNMGGIPDGMVREAVDVKKELAGIAAELAAKKLKPKEAKAARERLEWTPEQWAAEREAAEARAAEANRNSVMRMMDVIITTYVVLTMNVDIRIENMIDFLKSVGRWEICIDRCQISFGKDAEAAEEIINAFMEIMKRDGNRDIINESLATLREALKRPGKKSESYEVCVKCIATTVIERKENAEVLTPLPLVREMLAQIPAEAWRPDAKIWDPAVGKGAFMVVAYEILFDALAAAMPDAAARHRHIIENMLYFSDINSFNIYVTLAVLDPDGKCAANAFLGNSLEQKFADDFKFDMVIGNPPYNKGPVRSAGKTEKDSETLWPYFVSHALDMIIPGGYLAYITPSTWLNKTSKTHVILLSNQMMWLRLWDHTKSLRAIGAEISISLYVMRKMANMTRAATNVTAYVERRKIRGASSMAYLSPIYATPLAHHSIFDKLRRFIDERKCDLTVMRKTLKSVYIGDQIDIPDAYALGDMYSVDTYHVNPPCIKVYKMSRIHPDADKHKIIIANKSSLSGVFVDDGRLGLCGGDKFYILGDNLHAFCGFLRFKIFMLVSHLVKYRGGFLEKSCFDYIPDVRQIPGGISMTEDEFYTAIGLTPEEICIVQQFNKK